jgi:hypothetical protein
MPLIGREQDCLELRAAVSLGRLWLGQGKRAQPGELVAPLSDRFDAGLDCDALSEARVLLRGGTM